MNFTHQKLKLKPNPIQTKLNQTKSKSNITGTLWCYAIYSMKICLPSKQKTWNFFWNLTHSLHQPFILFQMLFYIKNSIEINVIELLCFAVALLLLCNVLYSKNSCCSKSTSIIWFFKIQFIQLKATWTIVSQGYFI